MQQLTGLDASFLALETATTTGHVGGLCVLDPGGAPRPLTLARLTEMLAERIPLVPVLRRKLLQVPLGLDQPYWIDDADFDLEYHVREVALPRPGSDAQLTEQVARLHARPLDRSRPLWEIYLITGLARPQGLVDQISDFAPPALTARAARVVFATGLLHRLPPFNITISNVPGPNVPVYLAGAKLIAHYPVSVVTDGQGLNITLVGYLGQLHFGLVSCRELVPDIDVLAGYLVDELGSLVKAAGKRTAATGAAG